MPWLDGQAQELRIRAGEREKEDLQQENVGQVIQLKRWGLVISGDRQEARKKPSMSKIKEFGNILPNFSGVTFSHEFIDKL